MFESVAFGSNFCLLECIFEHVLPLVFDVLVAAVLGIEEVLKN